MYRDAPLRSNNVPTYFLLQKVKICWNQEKNCANFTSQNAAVQKYLEDNINKAFVALLYIPAVLVNLRLPICNFPDKETIYRNSGTSLSLTNNFLSLNGERLRGVPALNDVY